MAAKVSVTFDEIIHAKAKLPKYLHIKENAIDKTCTNSLSPKYSEKPFLIRKLLAGPSVRAYLGSRFEMFMVGMAVLEILRPD